KQKNVFVTEVVLSFLVPNADLYFADMTQFEHKHAHPRLSNAPTNRLGQFTIHQHLMERQFHAIRAFSNLQLPEERFLVHTDAHRRKLKSRIQYRVPNQNISIQALVSCLIVTTPVVVVSGSTVM